MPYICCALASYSAGVLASTLTVNGLVFHIDGICQSIKRSVPAAPPTRKMVSHIAAEPCVDSWMFHCMKIAPAVAPLPVKSMSEISTTPLSPGSPTLITGQFPAHRVSLERCGVTYLAKTLGLYLSSKFLPTAIIWDQSAPTSLLPGGMFNVSSTLYTPAGKTRIFF